MTYTVIAARARSLARMSTSGTTDVEIWPMINMIYNQFAEDVHGLPFQDYIAIAAKFFPRTHFGFHLVIVGSSNNDIDSDIAVTDADADEQTGTEMATELQAQIRTAIGVGADLTVTWSNFAFTVGGIDSTSIVITEPEAEETYVNYVNELFGGNQSEVKTIVCDFPEGCTREQDLPADTVSVNTVMWDDYLLVGLVDQSMFEGIKGTGDPLNYMIRGKKLMLAPAPAEQKKLYIDQKRLPALDAAPDGDSDITEIPISYHLALCYGLAAMLLEDTFEENIAKMRREMYWKGVKKYICDNANVNTNTKRTVSNKLRYGVTV